LAAGIRRVKGVRRLGLRIGNWLAAEQSKHLLTGADRGIATRQEELCHARDADRMRIATGRAARVTR
jgi:hypothetical protein